MTSEITRRADELRDVARACATLNDFARATGFILGWPTMRFTGAEIMRDPNACAADVAAYLCGGVS